MSLDWSFSFRIVRLARMLVGQLALLLRHNVDIVPVIGDYIDCHHF